ncbi:peptidase domain-containing ABC transporter [Chryseobacterium sp.]|uniref:peptidase domain-containing ABC transporter n=1 Tax=Chryseobacterium sp. TaxID=1871047 RepID=UPI0025BEA2F8|nr:peptidase domain-containing ABC transporter [Chryseobacterium sp.]MBV8326782.1 peptidase domain-containing ABC transporter [Chryseobacterium sp.]
MIFVHQRDQMDCGPACLSMVTKYFGKNISLNYIREISYVTREGVNLLGISDAAEKLGFETFPAHLSNEELELNKENLPCIVHWNQNHFVVLYEIKINRLNKKKIYRIADPAHGFVDLPIEKFNLSWHSDNKKGVVLFLHPTEKFNVLENNHSENNYLRHIIAYTKPFKKQIGLMLLMLFLGSCISFVFPFLTQKLIDKGVNAKDMNLIGILLLAQLVLFVGSISFEIIRNWLMLIVGTKLSVNIVSDFLKKLFRLPLSFFETKNIGDFNQRILDNGRIERFLTSQSLVTSFSILTFSAFFIVLWYYNIVILLVYTIMTVIAVLWSVFWLRKRKKLDYFRFQQSSEHQQGIYEIVNGVTEMKLYQMEDYKLNKWEDIQKRLLATNIRLLKIDQIQSSGFEFTNQLKNIIVTFIAAKLVVDGRITLGAMLSVSYIIGQMNAPLNQLITFLRSLQDAKLSMERIYEVETQPEEEKDGDKEIHISKSGDHQNVNAVEIKNVSFQYQGPKSNFVLKNVSFDIPEGKVTAIVGASGSGKTTLMKLLLKFYPVTDGDIQYHDLSIKDISARSLREKCGVVMQDGYILSETIERNIATSAPEINEEELHRASRLANITSFIDELPLGYKTKIGAAGNEISGGQKQRILIARAVYKKPQFLFFDEATSALDTENEKIIHDHLQTFFKGRTVVIIAHRLSTVKNADQIIVLKHGQVVEQGTHQDLVSLKKEYFNLVKNQLELGN